MQFHQALFFREPPPDGIKQRSVQVLGQQTVITVALLHEQQLCLIQLRHFPVPKDMIHRFYQGGIFFVHSGQLALFPGSEGLHPLGATEPPKVNMVRGVL